MTFDCPHLTILASPEESSNRFSFSRLVDCVLSYDLSLVTYELERTLETLASQDEFAEGK
jgi:hypothetical protein